jgi:hypothetical protein
VYSTSLRAQQRLGTDGVIVGSAKLKAVHTFDGGGDDDLLFQQGDFLIGHKHVDGWWYGEHTTLTDDDGNAQTGRFPNNYVEYISQDADDDDDKEEDDEEEDVEDEDDDDDDDDDDKDGKKNTITTAALAAAQAATAQAAVAQAAATKAAATKAAATRAAATRAAATRAAASRAAATRAAAARAAARRAAAARVAAQASVEQKEQLLREHRRLERRKARIRDEREDRAHAVEEARLTEIENAKERDRIWEENLADQKLSKKSEDLRKQRQRLAKQTRHETLKSLTPEARKAFTMKRRELVTNAIQDESKKIENERSAFQYELDGTRATIRRVNDFLDKTTSAQTLALLNTQLEAAKNMETTTVRSLANLSTTKADRLTHVQEEAELRALLFAQTSSPANDHLVSKLERRSKCVSSSSSSSSSTTTTTTTTAAAKSNNLHARAKSKPRFAYAANRGVRVVPRCCNVDVEIDLSDAARVALNLRTANKVFATSSKLRKLEIAIGMNRSGHKTRGRGGRSVSAGGSAGGLGSIPRAATAKKKKKKSPLVISDSERRRNLFQQNSRHHQTSQHMFKILPTNLRGF